MGRDTDKILGTGLIAALIIFIVGQFCALLFGRETLPMEIGGTIVTGLVGYMGRSLAEKIKQPLPEDKSKPPTDKETLGGLNYAKLQSYRPCGLDEV